MSVKMLLQSMARGQACGLAMYDPSQAAAAAASLNSALAELTGPQGRACIGEC